MKKLLKSALAALLTLSMAITFTACGPGESDGDSESVVTGDSLPIEEEQSTSPLSQPQDDSSVLQTTDLPASDDPSITEPEPEQTEDTSTEATTVSTTVSTTEKTTGKTTAKTTAKTEKTTEKTTEETEPVEGSRLPDDEDDEEIDIGWEDIDDIDEWLEMIGASGEEIPDIEVNE